MSRSPSEEEQQFPTLRQILVIMVAGFVLMISACFGSSMNRTVALFLLGLGIVGVATVLALVRMFTNRT